MLGAFRKSEFGRSVLKLGTGTAIGQGLVLLASPIWSRLYEPADLARLGLFLSFINTATVAVALRYDLAIPLGKKNDDALTLLLLSLVLIGPVAVLCGIFLAMLSANDLLGFGELPVEAAFIAAGLLMATGVFTALRYWHVGAGNFGQISRSLVLQGVGRAVVPILLAPLKLGWIGLIAGEVAGRTFGTRKLLNPVLPALQIARTLPLRPRIKECAWRYRRFPLIFLPSSVLDAVSAAVALPLFVMLHGLAIGGNFMLAQQVVAAPAALLCASLADVYHQRIVAVAREAPAAVVPMLLRSGGRLLALSMVVLLPVAAFAPFVAGWVFGPQWSESGLLVAVLAPSTAISIAASSLSRALVLTRIPQLKLIADVLKLVLPAAGMIVGYDIGETVTSSAIGFSIMFGVSYALYFLVILYAVRPAYQTSDA